MKVRPDARLPDPGEMPRVMSALMPLAGVTEFTSVTVPLLLLPPGPGGGKLPFAEKHRRLDNERVGEADCYRVRCTAEIPNLEDGSGSEWILTHTYWIDRRSYLIRRVRQEGTLPDGLRLIATIDYEPMADAAIDPAELEFRPPKKP